MCGTFLRDQSVSIYKQLWGGGSYDVGGAIDSILAFPSAVTRLVVTDSNLIVGGGFFRGEEA